MRSLRIRFWEWLDRQSLRLADLAAALSTVALRRRARLCGCDVCSRAGDPVAEAEAIRELIAKWPREAPAVARDERVN
jgi:hypothetical protein